MASIPYSSTCVHLFAGLGVNQCFISPQFSKGRSGPWSRALAQSLPTSKQCLLTMKGFPRTGMGKKNQNNLLTIYPVYCTCLAIQYSQSLDCTTALVFGTYLSVSFECHHFAVHCNPKYGQIAKSLISLPLSQALG